MPGRVEAAAQRRLPGGFHRLIAAQFASALADHALLIVTIALLQRQGAPGWWAPMLKVGFTLSYVLLAPLIGPLADAVPKARLMAWMNGVKVLGVATLLAGVSPLAGYALVGFGAAAYAPAKYGLVTELVPARQLVAANGWIEVTVVGAALLGAVLGGLLVSPAWLDGPARGVEALVATTALPGAAAVGPLAASLLALLGVYGLSSGLNRGLPDSGARYPAAALHPRALWCDFRAADRRLWRDRLGRLSLAATTIFWGVGATLQFIVLRWAHDRLGLGLDRAAMLQAAVAVGVAAGAAAAGRWVPLARADRMLGAGVLLGLTMPVMAWIDRLALAVPMLMLVGAVGGLMVVPLNALLQHRGAELLSAGRSIAVQGYNENASVLVMLAVYAALDAAGVPIVLLMSGFGLAIAAAILALMRRHRRSAPGRLTD